MGRSRVVNLANFQQFTAINLLSDAGAIGGPVVIPNACRVILRWLLADGKVANNVMCGSVPAGFTPTVTQANNILTALTTGGAWTALAAFIAPTASLASVQLLDIRTPGQPIINASIGGAPGTSTGTELPDETAVVITLRTALTGPGARGRIYVPGWATNVVATGNVVAATAVTALQTWANTIPTALSAQGLTFALALPARAAYTGSTGTQHPARAARTQQITQQVVRDNHFDSQRRRGLR